MQMGSRELNICFVSNYINHHQIPFCTAMIRQMEMRGDGSTFCFVQTQKMEEERIRMGWDENNVPDFVVKYYENPEKVQERVDACDLVIFGGCDDESFIQNRLRMGRPVLRYCERMYKSGQWKAVSPRGLKQKYHDHTRYRKAPVYVLCAGGYVADDFHIVRAYPGKMFCFGYFPETKTYDVDRLMQEKGYPVDNGSRIPYLLWTGRMIDWKHPELALETARYLKEKGIPFHMDMIGGGALEEEMKRLCREYQLEEQVDFPGFLPPQEVRKYMEKADVYLFTSDRGEGWGAVANESMNSGCAIVMNHMIGAAPYLILNGENGFLYRDGDRQMLFHRVEELVQNPELRQRLGRKACATIQNTWNAENAAEKVTELIRKILDGTLENKEAGMASRDRKGFAPCEPAPVIPEKKMFRYLT